MSKKYVLVVGNDKTITQALAGQLKEVGFIATAANDVQSALGKIRETRPDAILLGFSTESVGDEFLSTIRAEGEYHTSVPVVLVVDRGQETEALHHIETGADDFVVKGARSSEIAARLQVCFYRAKMAEAPSRAVALRAGPIFLNVDRKEAYLRLENGEVRPLNLTKREFGLIRVLMSRKNAMMSRQQLVEEAFGEGAKVNPTNLGAYIHRLREKVEPDPANPRHILTDRGLGFKIVD